MEIVLKRNKLVDIILPSKKMENEDYRLSRYVQRVDMEEGILLYHLMTGEMVLTSSLSADADELFKKGFLVAKDHDDYKLYMQFNKLYGALLLKNAKTINAYTILTTTDCNARCFYCYELGTKRVAMSSETAKRTIEYIKANADLERKVTLSWFGGEPLYNDSVIDEICTALKNENIEYSSSMISNGYLFDEAMIKKAKELWKLDRIQITLDGTEDIYNKRKAYIYRDGNSAYKRVIENIKELSQMGINVNIRLNFDRKNQEDLLKLIEELSNTFKDEKEHIFIYCHELFQCSEDEGISDLKKTVDEKIKECGFYKKKYVSLRIKMNYCMADSTDSIIIMPDGSLHSCEHFNVHKSVGSIYNNDNKKSALPYYRERIMEENCEKCPVLPQCFKLKCCPNEKRGCSEEIANKKVADIREAMVHYVKEYREKHE